MIPSANKKHVVIELKTDRFDDFAGALSDAAIFPRAFPRDGSWGTFRLPVERFDFDLVIHYQFRLQEPWLDAYQIAGPANEVRIGLRLARASARLVLWERSTGTELAAFDYSMSGRAMLFASVESVPARDSLFLVINRLPEFHLDDQSGDAPLPLPRASMENAMAQITNREFRAQLVPGGLPESRFPITPRIEYLDKQAGTLGAVFRDPVRREDRLDQPVCLPAGLGSGDCAPNADPAHLDFYEYLNGFARFRTADDPVTIHRLGRQVQVDIGSDVLRRELEKNNGWGDWKDATVFRYRAGSWITWSRWPGGSAHEAAVRLEGKAKLQIAYPKIKWCKGWTKTPWGRISYKYPCGITRGWSGLKNTRAHVHARLTTRGDTQVCIQLSRVETSGSTNLFGMLLLAVYAAIAGTAVGFISQLLASVVLGAALILGFILVFLEAIIGLLASFIPRQACLDIRNFLKFPIVEDRVELNVSRPAISFNTNGISIACDTDFEGTP